jgi:hypothetical protein
MGMSKKSIIVFFQMMGSSVSQQLEYFIVRHDVSNVSRSMFQRYQWMQSQFHITGIWQQTCGVDYKRNAATNGAQNGMNCTGVTFAASLENFARTLNFHKIAFN